MQTQSPVNCVNTVFPCVHRNTAYVHIHRLPKAIALVLNPTHSLTDASGQATERCRTKPNVHTGLCSLYLHSPVSAT
jgi:hypothetical protein